MYQRILALLTILLTFSSIKGNEDTANAKKVVCYYGGTTAKEVKLSPKDIDPSVCTHIIFLRGDISIKSEEIYIGHYFQNHPEGGAGYTERLLRLKEANPNLKLLLQISSERLQWATSPAERRSKFIQSGVALLKSIGFDGLDFPTYPGHLEDVTTFFCEMKAEFDKHGFSVSTLAYYQHDSTTPNPAIERISRCFSFFAIITFENWVQTSTSTKLIAPLNLTRTVVDENIKKGIPANKLLISIPTFSLIVTLADLTQTGLGVGVQDPETNGTEYTHGYDSYYRELSKRLNNSTEGWTIVRGEEADSPYAYSKTGKWVSYEDPISTAAKARYVLEKQLGGVLIYTMDMDDFDAKTGKTFPITRAVKDTFEQGVRPIDES